MELIQETILHIMERIKAACKKAGRDPKEVQLLLATKTVEPKRILQAFACGCTLIGENKVQELRDKYEALPQFRIRRILSGICNRIRLKRLFNMLNVSNQSITSIRRKNWNRGLHRKAGTSTS